MVHVRQVGQRGGESSGVPRPLAESGKSVAVAESGYSARDGAAPRSGDAVRESPPPSGPAGENSQPRYEEDSQKGNVLVEDTQNVQGANGNGLQAETAVVRPMTGAQPSGPPTRGRIEDGDLVTEQHIGRDPHRHSSKHKNRTIIRVVANKTVSHPSVADAKVPTRPEEDRSRTRQPRAEAQTRPPTTPVPRPYDPPDRGEVVGPQPAPMPTMLAHPIAPSSLSRDGAYDAELNRTANVVVVGDDTEVSSVGSGVVVITNRSADSKGVLAIDTKADGGKTSRVYEPPHGWSSIGDVCIFSLCVFAPIALYVLYRACSWLTRNRVGMVRKLSYLAKYCWDSTVAGCANFCRLRNVRDEDAEMLGSEGALYLALQRETLLLILMMTSIGCAVLLPLHYSIGTARVKLDFARGTIQHLGKHSDLLWVHLVLIYVTSILYFRYVWRCRGHVQRVWQSGVLRARSTELWDASVFVKCQIPQDVNESEIKSLLEVIYPGKVDNVVTVMDQSNASMLEEQLIEAEQDLRTLRRIASFTEDKRTTQLIREKEEVVLKIREQQVNVQERHAGKAIITFVDKETAILFADSLERRKAIYAGIARTLKGVKLKRFTSSEAENVVSNIAEVLDESCGDVPSYLAVERATAAVSLKDRVSACRMLLWEAVPSPDPHDIIWASLHLDRRVFWVRTILANAAIISVLLLLTAPTSFLQMVSSIGNRGEHNPYSHFVSRSFVSRLYEDLPALGAFLFAFLPQIVMLSVNGALLFSIYILAKYWEPHDTLSSQEISVLRKSFWFLMINIVLIPSVTYTCLGNFVGDLITNDNGPFATLGQVFVVTSGTFTLSYVIAQTFVGSAVQLANVSNMIWSFVCGNAVFRRWASAEDTRKQDWWKVPFEFGSQYASFLSMLALIVMYSNTVPIILPFGVLYFVVKHCTDQYQLHFACGRDQSHSVPRCKIGRAAVRYLPIPLIFFQLVSLGYFLSYVCLPNEIAAIASGQHPQGCKIVEEDDSTVAVPGTLTIRGTTFQLLLLFILLVYTTSDCIYCSMVDTYNEEGLIQGAGFAEQPYITAVHLFSVDAFSSKDGWSRFLAGALTLFGIIPKPHEDIIKDVMPESSDAPHDGERNGEEGSDAFHVQELDMESDEAAALFAGLTKQEEEEFAGLIQRE